tara:strand:- start:311 stop:496 length:186 start_codon:yes stop_codon:yes gene_type:complete
MPTCCAFVVLRKEKKQMRMREGYNMKSRKEQALEKLRNCNIGELGEIVIWIDELLIAEGVI